VAQPMSNTPAEVTLEQEIVAALAEAEINSSDLSALIERVEAAIAEADQAAETARSNALDPALSPNAKAAREAMVAAEFDRARLRTVLPRLQQRLQEVQAQEYAARWLADYEQVKIKRDALAQEYGATYPKIVAQFVDLFSRAEAADKEVSRVNGSAPAGEHRRLRQTELVARGLGNFSRADPPITKAVQLPDWTNSEKMAWPPAEPSLAVQFATSMTFSHPSGDWWQQREERAQAMREEHARVIEHYDAMEREREERENAEAASVAAAAARRSRA
jgi:predicted transcriptional regulator